MGIRNLLDSLKPWRSRTPVQRVRRAAPRRRPHVCRLAVEALEDRSVPASLSISDVSIIEGNAGTRNALLTVTLTGSSKPQVSVDYGTAGNTARAGTDYQAVSGKLTFNKGTTSKTIVVPVLGDTSAEPDENFFVNLWNARKATIADGQGVVTIVNDDTQITIGDTWLSEGNSGTTKFDFTVNLSTAIGQPVTVDYATADGSASNGSDYQAASGTLTIPAGQTSGIITVLVNGDLQSESNESFYVNLSGATNGVITDGQGVGNILDDEPYVNIVGVAAVEGNSGTTAFDFIVSLSTPYPDATVTVDFATADDLATIADNDYVANSGTVTFAPGVTVQTITVLVNGDLLAEYDEYFQVNLSNPTNAQLGASQAWGTILSDDNAVLHVDSVWDYEPDPYYGGYTVFAFNAWLSNPFSEIVTVDFATADGWATEGYDYLANWGTLTFAPGDTVQTIYVTVLPDFEYEWDETFSVILSNASSNALIQPGWDFGTGTIFDNQGDYWW